MAILGVVWSGFVALLSIPAMQVAFAMGLFWLGGWLVVKYPKLKQAWRWGEIAYLYAEDQGLLNNLKGAEKWKPFRDKLAELCRKETGKEPTPFIVGQATTKMEKCVDKEHEERAKNKSKEDERQTQENL